MRVVFEDDDLRRLAEDVSYAPRRWGADIIKFETDDEGRMVMVIEMIDYH